MCRHFIKVFSIFRRLWLVPSGKPGRSEEIGYRDFLPERPLDTVDMLIAKANKKFSHSSNKSNYFILI